MWLVTSSSLDISNTDPAWMHFCNHKGVDDSLWIIVEWMIVWGICQSESHLSIFSKGLQHVERHSRTVWPIRDRELPTWVCLVLTTSHTIIYQQCVKDSNSHYIWSFWWPSWLLVAAKASFTNISKHILIDLQTNQNHIFRINFDGDVAQFPLVS